MAGPLAIAIGHFDGVHRGHAALLAAARRQVGGSGEVAALSFDPHPLCVLRPATAPPPVSTLAQRRRWLIEAGADRVVVLEPTREFLSQGPEEFLDRLIRDHRPAAVVEGPDFRFGRDRRGDVATIEAHGRRNGYRCIVVEPVTAALDNGEEVKVSSTMVRWLAARGRVRDAWHLLGRPYELEGVVVPGEGRGRELGVPTANLDAGRVLLPADGIYAGTALGPDGEEHAAAISVGTKPTFGGGGPRVCEACLLDGEAPAGHGWPMTLRFHDWLRDQIAFQGAGPLVDQIRRDIERVRECTGALCPVR